MAWSIVYRDYVAGGGVLSWSSDADAASYDVRYDSSQQIPTNFTVNDPAPTGEIIDNGSSLSWTNNTGGPVYANWRFVYTGSGALSPWQLSSDQLLSA